MRTQEEICNELLDTIVELEKQKPNDKDFGASIRRVVKKVEKERTEYGD